jgi:hypothetical protein
MVLIVLYPATPAAASADRPANRVVPHLGGDDLLLERRQQALRFRKRQAQVGDIGDIVRPLDFHDFPAPSLALGAGFYQPQNPGHAFPRSKTDLKMPAWRGAPKTCGSAGDPWISAGFCFQNPLAKKTNPEGNREW